jgi:uncharacterized membrane protein YoaK (UPF0700 family)
MVDVFNPMIFLTILILTFALFLVITGAFTAYFGSGKSRKIGGGLLGGGVVLGVVWILAAGPGGPIRLPDNLVTVVLETVMVILAAAVGAILAIGIFLLAIMKS